VLFISVNGSSPVALLPFTIRIFESSSVQLLFVEHDRITFTTTGTAIPIHIAGWLFGGIATEVNNRARMKIVMNKQLNLCLLRELKRATIAY
jgi:hypothetical protein